MKILYIRRKDCIYLKGFTDTSVTLSNDVYILDLKQGEYCDLRNDQVTSLIKMRLLFKIPGISYLVRYMAALIFIIRFRYTKWDTCHILNLKRENFWLLPFIYNRSKKILITVFGRSTYINRMKRICFRSCYKYAKFITFEHRDSIREFKFYNRNVPDSKLIRLYPPITHFRKEDFLFSISKKERAVQELKLDPALVHIVCSSTISTYDQHYRVIDAVKKIYDKNKVQIIFLLTYGGTDKERERIIRYANENLSEFNVRIFREYLTDEQLRDFRFATDIYINLRKTDQLAGAVLESVAAGALLISGSWLNYHDFDNLGIHYEKVNNFEALTQSLDRNISDISNFKNIYAEDNSRKIINEYAFESVTKKWIDLYTT